MAIELLGFISTTINPKVATTFDGNSIFVLLVDETVERDESFDYGYAHIS